MKWSTRALDSIATLDRQSIHPSEVEPQRLAITSDSNISMVMAGSTAIRRSARPASRATSFSSPIVTSYSESSGRIFERSSGQCSQVYVALTLFRSFPRTECHEITYSTSCGLRAPSIWRRVDAPARTFLGWVRDSWLLSRFPFRPSKSRSGLRAFWMRRTPCGPSVARPSASLTPSSNPPSSACSATPSPIPWGGSKGTFQK